MKKDRYIRQINGWALVTGIVADIFHKYCLTYKIRGKYMTALDDKCIEGNDASILYRNGWNTRWNSDYPDIVFWYKEIK